MPGLTEEEEGKGEGKRHGQPRLLPEVLIEGRLVLVVAHKHNLEALGFVVLFTAAVPWYWAVGGGETPLVFGMPLWVAVSTGVSFLISCLTAWAAFSTWPSDNDGPEGGS